MSQRAESFILGGGLDMVTPTVAIAPGRAVTAVNYWMTERGYERMAGYERYDGRLSPSDAWFDIVQFSQRTTPNAITVGATVTGGAASGKITAVVDDEFTPFLASETGVSASAADYVASAAVLAEIETGYMVVADATATFAAGQNLTIAAVPVAVVANVAARNSGPTVALEQEYAADAADLRRAQIGPVPGIGPVRGAVVYNGQLYAFRNADANLCRMYKATPTGWAMQAFGHTVNFTSGTVAFPEGATFTRGLATGTIRRVVVTSGAWNTGTAAGYLVLSEFTGTWSAGTGTGGGGSAIFSSTAPVAFTMSAAHGGNQISFTKHSFLGIRGGERLYIAYGRGRAFEWDGTTATPIRAPVSNDQPTLVRVFRNHLFLFYREGSMLFSELGNPYLWTTTGGAGEIALGSFPRDALEAAQTALLIVCRTKILYLTGNDATDFVLEELTDEAGGWARTAQNIGRPVYMDRRGLREFAATDTSAGFAMSTLSNDIEPVLERSERAKIMPWTAVVSANRSHYRAWLNDFEVDSPTLSSATPLRQVVLCAYMEGDPQFTQIEMPHVVWCACSTQTSEGDVRERMFVGCLDGYVRQLDRGTSFDGTEIFAYIRLPFNMARQPQGKKRWHSIEVETDAEGSHEIAVSADFDYGDGERPFSPDQTDTVIGGGGYWDEAFWDSFNWSAPVSGVLRQRLDGIGQSCSVAIASRSRHEPAHTLTSARFHWSQRSYRR